jgi:hypothetical protein
MTTPATYNTPYRVIRTAMEDCGLIEDGADPSGEQLAKYMNRLNDLFQSLQVRPGLKLWLNNDLAVQLTQGTNLYTLGTSGTVVMTRPMRIIEGYFYDINAKTRRPLISLARTDWDTLSVTSTQGSITNYFTDKQQNTLNVYVWLTPDSYSATLGSGVHLIIQQQVAGLVSLNDSMNFPIEWFNTLHWMLAQEICTGQPQAVIARCNQMAAYWLQILEDWDVEDASTSFAPDQRINQGVGRFR